jgi:hypothetical protein
LNIEAPHRGHIPFTALRPPFIISSTASAIGFLALHLSQQPSCKASTDADPAES